MKHTKNYSFISAFKKYVNASFILIFVTAMALFVANSKWGDLYRSLAEVPVSFSIGEFNLFSHHGQDLTLLEFINDFLMATFFFAVGLEIKREILVGELSSLKKALLPIIGACGGMIVPVILFYVFCPGDPIMQRGMAIPMATDIAFSLGVLSLFGKRVPIGMKVFLATLAVADDLGGIIVIALFYSSEITLEYLALCAFFILILLVGNLRHVRTKMFYILTGICVWYALLNSGIHATIAGVITAMFVPGRPKDTAIKCVEYLHAKITSFPLDQATTNKQGITILSNHQISLLKNIEYASDRIISPLQSLEDSLQVPINYVVVPLFAFANAGIYLEGVSLDGIINGVGLAIFLGLFLGKFLGVCSFSWLAIKLKLVQLPNGCNWKNFASVCMLTGIGFTVSLFIADLSYHGIGGEAAALLNDAKLGILLGSIAAGITGWLLLYKFLPKTPCPKDKE
ncbi:MAG: Na+/H+ antiporter NhaA [Paraprevotella sp.]|jgi:NhaA family Na+:H+ antiporter|nr:Na+/H+ antiporter NhaA [Paraprevotella sp.]